MATRHVTPGEIASARRLGSAARHAGADYLSIRELDDGRAVYLVPMTLGNLRLAIGDRRLCWFDDLWCYQAHQADAAWTAALGWDGEGEPEGWYRHPATGRRRSDGTAASEVVRW